MATEIRKVIGEQLKWLLKADNFSLLSDERGDERHGSWEWVYHKRDTLERYVIATLTSLPLILRETSRSEYAIEIWIGVEEGNRYVRQLVEEFIAEDAFFDDSSKVMEKLSKTLGDALRLVSQFNTSDLTEAYFIPRKPAVERKEKHV